MARRSKSNPNNCPFCGVFVHIGFQKDWANLPKEAREHICDQSLVSPPVTAADEYRSLREERKNTEINLLQPARAESVATRLSRGLAMLDRFEYSE